MIMIFNTNFVDIEFDSYMEIKKMSYLPYMPTPVNLPNASIWEKLLTC